MTLKSVDTLLDVLHFADSHTAVIVPELGIRVSYDSLRQQVLAMADALATAGIRRADRVAIVLPNGLPAIVSFLAASIAGTAAPLNPAYPYEEFFFFLEDTAARILICPPTGAEEARSAAADRNIPVFSVEMSDQGTVRLLNAPKGISATAPSADDVALILTPAEAPGGRSVCPSATSTWRSPPQTSRTPTPFLPKTFRSALCRCSTFMAW